MNSGKSWAWLKARRRIWRAGFLRHLKDRDLKSVRLTFPMPAEAWLRRRQKYFPRPDWQRCVVHFYRNVFSHVPNGKVAEIARKNVRGYDSRAREILSS
jgi:putative transposase